MKKFVIERNIPGLSTLNAEELQGIVQKSCEVVSGLGKPYHWIESYCTGDKMYCVHVAPDAETIIEHAKNGGFPVDKVSEVTAIIDPSMAIN